MNYFTPVLFIHICIYFISFKPNKRPKGPLSLTWVQWTHQKFDHAMEPKTRGPKGHISCTWVQCATFLTDRPFLLTHQPEKHKLGRRCWDLAYCQICWIPFSGSCQVSLNSVQHFQRRSRIYLSQSEAGAAILFFWPAPKTQTWKRTLRSCFLSSFVEFRSADSEKSKMSQPIKGQGGHLVLPIGPKNINLVEGVEILLPVKFHWIPFSSFRGEVENVSADQRPGRPSCFSDRPEKHKLGRVLWNLASCQVLLNSVQRFQRRSRKCLSQSEARAAILFFRSARKTQTW